MMSGTVFKYSSASSAIARGSSSSAAGAGVRQRSCSSTSARTVASPAFMAAAPSRGESRWARISRPLKPLEYEEAEEDPCTQQLAVALADDQIVVPRVRPDQIIDGVLDRVQYEVVRPLPVVDDESLGVNAVGQGRPWHDLIEVVPNGLTVLGL